MSLGLLLAWTAGPSEAARHVLLLAGQSNMLGQARSIDAVLPDTVANVLIWKVEGAWSGSWRTLRPGFGEDTTRFGPEVSLGRAVSEAMPSDSFYLVKSSRSSTALSSEWLPTSLGGPGYFLRTTEVQFPRAMGRLGDSAIVPEAVFWMQGESDALYAEHSLAYHDRLDSLVSEFRQRWGTGLPVIVGLVDSQPSSWSFAAVVRDAQRRVCRGNVAVLCVETRGLQTDGAHYTAAGQLEFGRLLAERWLRFRAGDVDSTPSFDPAEYRIVGIDGCVGPWLEYRGFAGAMRLNRRARGVVVVQLRDRFGHVESRRRAVVGP